MLMKIVYSIKTKGDICNRRHAQDRTYNKGYIAVGAGLAPALPVQSNKK